MFLLKETITKKLHTLKHKNLSVKETVSKLQKALCVGAGKIIKVTGFSYTFSTRMFRSRHDVKIHQLRQCVPSIESRNTGQVRSLGVQTMGDEKPGHGVIRYASNTNDIIHPIRYPALFNKRQSQVGEGFIRPFPDRGVTWPGALRTTNNTRLISKNASVFSNRNGSGYA